MSDAELLWHALADELQTQVRRPGWLRFVRGPPVRLKTSIPAACFAAFLAAGVAPIDHLPPRPADNGAALKTVAAQLRERWLAAHPGEEPDAAVQPSITTGTVNSATVNVQVAPAEPTLTYSFKTGVSGFYAAQFQFDSPSGNQSFYVYDTERSSNTVGSHLVRPSGDSKLYAENGTYTLVFAGIADYAGHYTSYSSSAQIASIFQKSSFVLINNGQPDTTAPSIASGKIVTPTVSLSAVRPYFQATLGVSDTISGVAQVTVSISDPNGNVYTGGQARGGSRGSASFSA